MFENSERGQYYFCLVPFFQLTFPRPHLDTPQNGKLLNKQGTFLYSQSVLTCKISLVVNILGEVHSGEAALADGLAEDVVLGRAFGLGWRRGRRDGHQHGGGRGRCGAVTLLLHVGRHRDCGDW